VRAVEQHADGAAQAQLEADLARAGAGRRPVDQYNRALELQPVEAAALAVARIDEVADDALDRRRRNTAERGALVGLAATGSMATSARPSSRISSATSSATARSSSVPVVRKPSSLEPISERRSTTARR
jgi:hypothetical protein